MIHDAKGLREASGALRNGCRVRVAMFHPRPGKVCEVLVSPTDPVWLPDPGDFVFSVGKERMPLIGFVLNVHRRSVQLKTQHTTFWCSLSDVIGTVDEWKSLPNRSDEPPTAPPPGDEEP